MFESGRMLGSEAMCILTGLHQFDPHIGNVDSVDLQM